MFENSQNGYFHEAVDAGNARYWMDGGKVQPRQLTRLLIHTPTAIGLGVRGGRSL